MLEHFPLGLHNPVKAWELLAFLATLFVFGIWRRDGWLSVAAGIGVCATLVSWQYGYRLSPNALAAINASSFWSGIVAIGIFLVAMIRGTQREER